jgi:hypothetical protein
MAIRISFSPFSAPLFAFAHRRLDENFHNLAGRTAKPLGFTRDKTVLNGRAQNMKDKAQMQQNARRGGSGTRGIGGPPRAGTFVVNIPVLQYAAARPRNGVSSRGNVSVCFSASGAKLNFKPTHTSGAERLTESVN